MLNLLIEKITQKNLGYTNNCTRRKQENRKLLYELCKSKHSWKTLIFSSDWTVHIFRAVWHLISIKTVKSVRIFLKKLALISTYSETHLTLKKYN